MKKPDYNFIFQVLEFLFKNRKVLFKILAKAGKGLKDICTLPFIKRFMHKVYLLQRPIMVPLMYVSFFLMGACVFYLSILKTHNLLISTGWLLFVFALACIEVKIVLWCTPKVKIKLLILKEE